MKKQVLLNIPEELLRQVEEFQKKEMISTRTGAINEIIRIGLKTVQKEMSNLREG